MAKIEQRKKALVRAYWWSKYDNFGDRLTAPILDHFLDFEVKQSAVQDADIVGIGSVLEHLKEFYGFVVGTGKLHEDFDIRANLDLGYCQIIGLRGYLSAKGLGDIPVGDLGLLADELVTVPTRDISLGIVPHWSDSKLAHDTRFIGNFSRLVIDVADDPLEVVRQIGRCERIVTSSLHGAITADAFGIPRRIEICENMISDPNEGGVFKFRDYHSTCGLRFRPGLIQKPLYSKIVDRKNEIYDMLDYLKRLTCSIT